MADMLAMLPMFFAHATRGGGMKTVYVGPTGEAYVIHTEHVDPDMPGRLDGIDRIFAEWGLALAVAIRSGELD